MPSQPRVLLPPQVPAQSCLQKGAIGVADVAGVVQGDVVAEADVARVLGGVAGDAVVRVTAQAAIIPLAVHGVRRAEAAAVRAHGGVRAELGTRVRAEQQGGVRAGGGTDTAGAEVPVGIHGCSVVVPVGV